MKKKMLFLSCTIMLCVTGCNKDYVQEVLVEETQSFVGNLVPEGTVDMSTIIVDAEDDEERDNTKGDTLIDTMADSIVDTIEDKERLKDLYNQYLQSVNINDNSIDRISFMIDGEYISTGPVDDIVNWTPQSMSIEVQKMYEEIINNEVTTSRFPLELLGRRPLTIVGEVEIVDYTHYLFGYIIDDLQRITEYYFDDEFISNNSDSAIVKWDTVKDAVEQWGFTEESLQSALAVQYSPEYRFSNEVVDRRWSSKEFNILTKYFNISDEDSQKFVCNTFSVNDQVWAVIIPQAISSSYNINCINLYQNPIDVTALDGGGYSIKGSHHTVRAYINVDYLIEEYVSQADSVLYLSDIDDAVYGDFPGIFVNITSNKISDVDKSYIKSIIDFNWTE